jgi:hypothetical protein
MQQPLFTKPEVCTARQCKESTPTADVKTWTATDIEFMKLALQQA